MLLETALNMAQPAFEICLDQTLVYFKPTFCGNENGAEHSPACTDMAAILSLFCSKSTSMKLNVALNMALLAFENGLDHGLCSTPS